MKAMTISAVVALVSIISIGIVGFAHPTLTIGVSNSYPEVDEEIFIYANRVGNVVSPDATLEWYVDKAGDGVGMKEMTWIDGNQSFGVAFYEAGDYEITLKVKVNRYHSHTFTTWIYVREPAVYTSSSTYFVFDLRNLPPIAYVAIAIVALVVYVVEKRSENQERYDIDLLYKPIPV